MRSFPATSVPGTIGGNPDSMPSRVIPKGLGNVEAARPSSSIGPRQRRQVTGEPRPEWQQTTAPTRDKRGARRAQTTAISGPRLANVVDISTHSNTTCAVTSDASVYCWAYGGYTMWCWGYNGTGLGNGVKTTSSTPVQVLAAPGGAGFTGVSELRAGSSAICAFKAADESFTSRAGRSRVRDG
jgi:hypothetical protein